jgi:type III secretory pathway component EscS
LVINFHVIVSAAVIAVVIGIVHVENNHQKPSDSHIIKFGLAIVFICWVTLFSWALLSLRAQEHTDPRFYANGSVVRIFPSPSSLTALRTSTD